MANHIWTIICDRVIVDSGSNEVSLIGVTERVAISGTLAEDVREPNVPFNKTIVSYWEREDRDVPESDFVVQISLRTPNGVSDEKMSRTFALDLSKSIRCRILITVGVIGFKGNGTYYFEIKRPVEDGASVLVTRIPLDFDVSYTVEPETS